LVSELTEADRQYLQQNMVWLAGSQWNDSHWCVTLENAALTMSVVVEQVDEAMFVEADCDPPAVVQAELAKALSNQGIRTGKRR